MLVDFVGRDQEKQDNDQSKWSNLHAGNKRSHRHKDSHNDENGGDLVLYHCSDRVATVRAFKVGQGRLSKGGFCHSHPLRDDIDLREMNQLHVQ